MSTPQSSAPQSPTPSPGPASGLFKDLVVLDLTLARAGPTTVRQFADWGANVITIEAPPGEGEQDMFRRSGHDFQNLHRNKRSVALDLKSEAGHAAFMQLVARADIIVENMRPPVKHRLKVDYESCAAVNPRVVYGSISGFGQDGPYATRPGVDQIAQGMGGLMSVTGHAGQGPVRVGIPIADLTSGMFLAQAILIALLDREVTGEGQWVHTSLIEAQIAMLDFQAARWTMKQEVAGQAGNDHPTGAPTGMFETADGNFNIAPTGNKMFGKFCAAIEAPDLAADPLFATNALRSKNRKALNARIAEIMKTKPSAHWFKVLDAAGIPAGPVNTIDQTFADPQVKHLKMARPVDHPRLGTFEIVGQPINMTATPEPDRLGPTPDAGQHTDEILTGLGYSREKIAELRAKGVV